MNSQHNFSRNNSSRNNSSRNNSYRNISSRNTSPHNNSSRNNSFHNPNKFFVDFLYEDKDIIAVNKPSGLPVISPDGYRAKSLYDIVTKHIQIKNKKGRAAIVHRLDKDSSGVMIFAKNAPTKKSLMTTWNDSVLERTYVALVEGKLEEQNGQFDTWLLEENAYRVIEVKPNTNGSLRAITDYQVLKENKNYSLVELSLQTGRRHQIRVQLASAGCPISGDSRYGAKKDIIKRLGLHANKIVFIHPWTKEKICIESPIPEEFISVFSQQRHA